jgi:hypothetical protein
MANVAKKENLAISIREYQNNQGETKKVWKTIGELITWDDGRQSFEVWGPTGSTRGNVFEQNHNDQPQQQNGQPQGQPAQQGGFQQQPARSQGFQQNSASGYAMGRRRPTVLIHKLTNNAA